MKQLFDAWSDDGRVHRMVYIHDTGAVTVAETNPREGVHSISFTKEEWEEVRSAEKK
jgi:hypothetical protein